MDIKTIHLPLDDNNKPDMQALEWADEMIRALILDGWRFARDMYIFDNSSEWFGPRYWLVIWVVK